jgi:hypothetical protein
MGNQLDSTLASLDPFEDDSKSSKDSKKNKTKKKNKGKNKDEDEGEYQIQSIEPNKNFMERMEEELQIERKQRLIDRNREIRENLKAKYGLNTTTTPQQKHKQ